MGLGVAVGISLARAGEAMGPEADRAEDRPSRFRHDGAPNPTVCRAAHGHSLSRFGGFTLMELLVVLVIISIGATAVVISLRPDARGAAREEGERLAILLGLASEESVMGGATLAWVGRPDGYEFHNRQLTDLGPDWMVVRGDELLHPRQLPVGGHIHSIRVDGADLAPGERVVLGSRVTHDLAVVIVLGDARVRVAGTEGRYEVTPLEGDGT